MVWQQAKDLGLGTLLPTREVEFQGKPSRLERTAATILDDEIDRRLRDAGDPGRLQTALGWLRRYRSAFPTVVLFKPRGGPDDLANSVYNERSLCALQMFIRDYGSVKAGAKGKLIPQATIAGYISSIRSATTVLSGVTVSSADSKAPFPRMGKQLRLEDPVDVAVDDRKIRLGLRARLLRVLIARGFDRHSRWGKLRWAVYTVGAQALLRGGEFGVTGKAGQRVFVRSRGLHWGVASLQWLTAAEAAFDTPSVFMHVCAIKDTEGRHKRKVIPIAARGAEVSDDPVCGYSALHTWASELGVWEWDEGRRAREPIFQWEGKAITTEMVCEMVREAAVALDIPPEQMGAPSMRIAGATDLRDRLGPEQSAKVIQARGRWFSDIHVVYERTTVVEMLESSVFMGEASNPEAETVLRGYAQPAGALL